MTKILITNHSSTLNKGDAALLNSTITSIGKFVPDADFTVLSYNPKIDSKRCNVKVLSAIGYMSASLNPLRLIESFKTIFFVCLCILWRLLKYLGLTPNVLIYDKTLQEYLYADIIIVRGGDTLTEDYGFFSFLTHSISVLFALLLKRPVVIYGHSIGPFKSKLNLVIARFILNRVNLIILREYISKKYLQEMAVNKPPIYVTADLAFLLQPSPHEIVRKILLKYDINKNNRPLVGISVSQLIYRWAFPDSENLEEKYNRYVKLMAHVVDHLTDELNATVIFVPHVSNDRIVANDIYQKVKHRNRVTSITDEYQPEDLKGIIGMCDLFIGARMHATIASTSMYVPTIAIAYSHKTYGIFGKMLGQEKWVCDIKTLDFNTLISKINDAWSAREQIRKDLIDSVKIVKERALLNGKLVKDLFDLLA